MSLIIDPGHGGADPGAMGNGIIEKTYNLEVSLYQYRRFKELGVPVKITRTTDKTIEPSQRGSLVKNSGMKHCISNHVNAGGGDGAEVIHSIWSNSKLPHIVGAELRAAGQNLRRVFSRKGANGDDYYYMHRYTGNVQTIIVEYGFLDSRGDDVAQLKRMQLEYAEAVVKAYCQYIGKKYVAPNSIKEPVKDAVDNVLPTGYINPSSSYSQDVKVIQTYLNYFNPASPLEVDGFYGPQTEAAISSFQKARGIKVDGYYGPQTRQELINWYAEKMNSTKGVSDKLYRVQVGAYSVLDNAEKQLEEARKHFKDAYISQ